MAARKPAAKSAKQSTSKLLVKWDEELAKYAEEVSTMEANSGGGQFFSLQNGVLSWEDAPMPGNQMIVIILDHIFETVYYDGPYDPNTPQSPVAFSFGRVQEEMRWHESSDSEFAGQLCSESEVCQWGSADKGKGKAARETRRLAMVPAGVIDKHGDVELIEDPSHYKSAQIGFMKLPVTSVKGFASFVKQVASSLKRPPFGVFTKVSIEPDPKNQFRVVFESLEPVSDEMMETIFARVKEVKEVIDFPYQMDIEEQSTPAKVKRGAKKPAKRATRRY